MRYLYEPLNGEPHHSACQPMSVMPRCAYWIALVPNVVYIYIYIYIYIYKCYAQKIQSFSEFEAVRFIKTEKSVFIRQTLL